MTDNKDLVTHRKQMNHVSKIHNDRADIAAMLDIISRYRNVTGIRKLTVLQTAISAVKYALRSVLSQIVEHKYDNLAWYIECQTGTSLQYVGPFSDKDVASAYGRQWQRDCGDNPCWNRVVLPSTPDGKLVVGYHNPCGFVSDQDRTGVYLRVISYIRPYHEHLMVNFIGPFTSEEQASGYGLHLSALNNANWLVVVLDENRDSFLVPVAPK